MVFLVVRVMSAEKMSSASRGENEDRPSDVPHTAVLVETSRPCPTVLAESSPGFPHTAVRLSGVSREAGARSTGLNLERGEGAAAEACGREHLSSSVSNHPPALKETVEETGSDRPPQVYECNDAVSNVEMSASSESPLTVETTQITTSPSPSSHSPVDKDPVVVVAGLVDDKETVEADDGMCSNEPVAVEEDMGSSCSLSDGEPSIMDLDVESLLDITPTGSTHHQARSVDEEGPKAKKASRKSRRAERDATSSPKKKRQKKALPNAFVAVRISSAEIHSKLKEVQDGMVAANERLAKVLVPIEKSHITLIILRLDGDEAVERWEEVFCHRVYLFGGGTLITNRKPNTVPRLDRFSAHVMFLSV